ncbi:MAG: alpha/beta fold hydrolase [Sneathiellaceae bacterium]
MPKVQANGITIAYEETGPADAPPVLLIMGLAAQLTLWPQDLVDPIAAAGFRVIRHDNRDVGLSTHFQSAGVPDLDAMVKELQAGRMPAAPYTLDDMAEDAVGLLDALSIPAAHVVGGSLGGMIAQILAARHPGRVLSLVPLFTSSGNRELPPGDPDAMAALRTLPEDMSSVDSIVSHSVWLRRMVGSPGFPYDEAKLRDFLRMNVERDYDPTGPARQFAAAMVGGTRDALLPKIAAPTLVVHGDRDPLFPIEHAHHLAANIPGAQLKVMEGMGHDLPPGYMPDMAAAMVAHFRSAQA